jgi:hypothetical protein
MTWTKSAIRAARKVPLATLLQQRGLALRDRGGGNVEPLNHPGVLIKASYWRWPERDLAGNTIDFLIQVEGKTFHQAMQIIAAADNYDASEQELREERGNDPEILR